MYVSLTRLISELDKKTRIILLAQGEGVLQYLRGDMIYNLKSLFGLGNIKFMSSKEYTFLLLFT
jgi:hypothetical protein